MPVAQGAILDASSLDFCLAHKIVMVRIAGQVAERNRRVRHDHVVRCLGDRPDSFEGWQTGPFGTVGPCVDGQADVLEKNRLGIIPVKQVKVLGSVAERPIGGVGGEKIVCAGEDAHGNVVDSPNLVQDKPNIRHLRPVAVEQIPWNKYSVRPAIPGQGQHASEGLPDLRPDGPTELSQESERPTDVDIGGVDEANHFSTQLVSVRGTPGSFWECNQGFDLTLPIETGPSRATHRT